MERGPSKSHCNGRRHQSPSDIGIRETGMKVGKPEKWQRCGVKGAYECVDRNNPAEGEEINEASDRGENS